MNDFLTALQFLTRIPVPARPYDPTSLARSAKFFPVIGLVVGVAAAAVHLALAPHLPRTLTALFVVAFLLFLTGCLHEDGLADTADGLGGGWTRDQSLAIMRDSRIGTYGAAALILSLLARILLLAALPLDQLPRVLIAAHILCRWTTLPLSHFLPAARPPADGQGARVAQLTTFPTLLFATAFAFTVVALLLRTHAIAPILATCLVTLFSGLYYRHRLGGVTGDTFGATNQLTELATYLCGVWA